MLRRSVIAHGRCVVFLCSPAQPFTSEVDPGACGLSQTACSPDMMCLPSSFEAASAQCVAALRPALTHGKQPHPKHGCCWADTGVHVPTPYPLAHSLSIFSSRAPRPPLAPVAAASPPHEQPSPTAPAPIPRLYHRSNLGMPGPATHPADGLSSRDSAAGAAAAAPREAAAPVADAEAGAAPHAAAGPSAAGAVAAVQRTPLAEARQGSGGSADAAMPGAGEGMHASSSEVLALDCAVRQLASPQGAAADCSIPGAPNLIARSAPSGRAPDNCKALFAN